MRLTEIIQPDCLRVPMEAEGRKAAILELVDLLSTCGRIADRDALAEAVWNREMTRTTGIGHGLAIPHGKASGCEQLCMAVGIAKRPIDFGAIDGQPVELIFLLASPVDQTGPHIQALAQISKLLMDPVLRNGLKKAETGQRLYELIEEGEKQTAG